LTEWAREEGRECVGGVGMGEGVGKCVRKWVGGWESEVLEGRREWVGE